MNDLLQAIRISLSDLAQIFLKMEDVKYIRELAWSRATRFHGTDAEFCINSMKAEVSQVRRELRL